MIKILFLASDPRDTARLRLGQELRDIRERLQLAKQRDSFILESRESVRPRDITQAIFDTEPQIVHFSGHGLSTEELCFEDALGRAKPVSPEALASLFELVAESVSCVVLNACYSAAQAEAIASHIPFVIGMNQAIGDEAAIAFAVGFYKALGAGRSFEDAYKFGCVEIQFESKPTEDLIPVGYKTPEYLIPVFHTGKLGDDSSNKKSKKLIDISHISNDSLCVTFTLAYTETGAEYSVKAPRNMRSQTVIERLIDRVAKDSPDSRFLQNKDMYDWSLFVQKSNSLSKVSPNVTLQAAKIENGMICELHAEINLAYATIAPTQWDDTFSKSIQRDEELS